MLSGFDQRPQLRGKLPGSFGNRKSGFDADAGRDFLRGGLALYACIRGFWIASAFGVAMTGQALGSRMGRGPARRSSSALSLLVILIASRGLPRPPSRGSQ